MTGRWPKLDRAALQGLPGRVVEQLSPHTEADPAAVLATFLAMAGAYIGDKPHVFAGDAEHPARLWPLVIGATADGMKGTSASAARRILRAADSTFDAGNVVGGLSSAEGLIERVRDPSGDPTNPDKAEDPGITDKRLIVVESEFAGVLARARREGNALSPLLRQAWDGGRLQTLTRRSTALTATGAHVVVVGHITPTELRLRLAEADVAGGLVNRFLPVLSRRSQRLASGGGAPEGVVDDLGQQLRTAKNAAASVGRVGRTPAAECAWIEAYPELTPAGVEEGPVAQVIARAVPQVLRLSLTFALLDCAAAVDVQHLEAALAVWRYVDASAEYLFGDQKANPDLDRLADFIAAAGDTGRTRQQVNADLFRGHRTAAQLDALIEELVDAGEVVEEQVPTEGRPAAVYRKPANKGEVAKELPEQRGDSPQLRATSRVPGTHQAPDLAADTTPADALATVRAGFPEAEVIAEHDRGSDAEREADRRRDAVFGRRSA